MRNIKNKLIPMLRALSSYLLKNKFGLNGKSI